MSDQAKTRQAVSAAVIGNVLEWYDFAVYGYVATIIAKNLFPSGSETSALLGTYLTFGIGFLARPLGGRKGEGGAPPGGAPFLVRR